MLGNTVENYALELVVDFANDALENVDWQRRRRLIVSIRDTIYCARWVTCEIVDGPVQRTINVTLCTVPFSKREGTIKCPPIYFFSARYTL